MSICNDQSAEIRVLLFLKTVCPVTRSIASH